MTSITGIITALTAEEAIRVLAEVADYQNRLPDPAELRGIETSLRDAATSDARLADYAQPGAAADVGDLARVTLVHRPPPTPPWSPSSPGPSAIPVTPPATRSQSSSAPWSSWPCRPRSNSPATPRAAGPSPCTKHPMRDSTLGQVISKLLTYLTGSK